ncbi:hypothetical protein ACJIZ3_019227 [Penstemon smallii]|uniref:DUF674 family protein n=1 Tax=Penstemon smallii TaxID=265156 RepID=A0ABD3T1I2_9LAMI
MSSAEEEVRLSMTVMINKEKTKVLFSIVDNNLADILLSFLTLPLGLIIRLFKKHYGDDEVPIIGSLNTLCDGLANLDSSHFWTESGKLMLLNPRNSLDDQCRKLKINIDDTYRYVSMSHDTERCDCGKLLNREIYEDLEVYNNNGKVFIEEPMNFLISDDLRLLPNVTASMIKSMKDLGITDTDGVEQMTVTIGFNEIMVLLKESLLSQTPLTDLILKKDQTHHSPSIKLETLPENIKKETTCSAKKMMVKAIVQKSKSKLLFVEAEEDFVDFLFSLLTIPLGEVECLLGGKASIWSIDNLYCSLSNLNHYRHMESIDTIEELLDPKLPPNYLSKNQILPISQQKGHPILYFKENDESMKFSCYPYYSYQKDYFKDPKGGDSFVKGPKVFMVTDDLTVTPLCMFSTISILNGLKIPLSDVEERELHIGLEEGLSILKASITSSSALTDGLINSILKKQPKQEN